MHVTGFSSCRITTMIHSYLVWFLWWLRHGAIGPSEATLFGVSVDWIDFRIYTFELVIRLSKVQQSALRFFSHFFEIPAVPAVPCETLWNAVLLLESRAEQPQTFCFAAASACEGQHDMRDRRQQACPFPAGVVSLVSGEVKHVVHLIRWNLKAVYANWGKTWPRSQKGNNARPLGS